MYKTPRGSHLKQGDWHVVCVHMRVSSYSYSKVDAVEQRHVVNLGVRGAKERRASGSGLVASDISHPHSSPTPGVFGTYNISITTPVVSALKNYCYI